MMVEFVGALRPGYRSALLAGLFFLILAGSGCRKPAKETAPAGAGKPQKAEAIEAFGTVKAGEIQDIVIDFPASVREIRVKEGQKVTRGQVLALLDLGDYELQIRKSEAELNQARLELKKLRTQEERLREDLKEAEAGRERAEAELAIKEKLHGDGIIAQSELDHFQETVAARRKAVIDARLALADFEDGGRAGSGSGITPVTAAQERVSALEAGLRRLKEKLNQSYIKGNSVVANMRAGVVYEIGYAAGDPLSWERKLLGLMNLDTLIVQANVAEEFIRDVKPGARARIVPTADSSREYKGTIARIYRMAVKDNGETVVPVEITIEAVDDFLLPNMNVDVTIEKA